MKNGIFKFKDYKDYLKSPVGLVDLQAMQASATKCFQNSAICTFGDLMDNISCGSSHEMLACIYKLLKTNELIELPTAPNTWAQDRLVTKSLAWLVQETEAWHTEKNTKKIGVPQSKIAKLHTCKNCDTTENVTKGLDPYWYEIHNDKKKYWMCEDCRKKSALDV